MGSEVTHRFSPVVEGRQPQLCTVSSASAVVILRAQDVPSWPAWPFRTLLLQHVVLGEVKARVGPQRCRKTVSQPGLRIPVLAEPPRQGRAAAAGVSVCRGGWRVRGAGYRHWGLGDVKSYASPSEKPGHLHCRKVPLLARRGRERPQGQLRVWPLRWWVAPLLMALVPALQRCRLRWQ